MLASKRAVAPATRSSACAVAPRPAVVGSRRACVLVRLKTDEKPASTSSRSDAEETTLKFGLEAGLLKTMSSKDGDPVSKADQAKQLLAQYGPAYLITSISFAIVSFTACWVAVESGLDVASLLSKVGIQVTDTSEKVGTFALAYAAHKALSPVRFPPTVALTPVVANWLGKKKDGSTGSQ